MKIIFLDFDGVIVVKGKAAPAAIRELNRVIHTIGARIVVTSTWRLAGLRSLERYFREWGLHTKITDTTPYLLDSTRGQEIESWMDTTAFVVSKFVILDDDTDMGSLITHLVQTDPLVGLTRDDADAVIERLDAR